VNIRFKRDKTTPLFALWRPIATFCLVAFCACAGLASARAQDISMDDAIIFGQDFLAENLDPDVLQQLSNIDPQTALFLTDFEDCLNNQYVLDLSELRKTADTVLPLLKANEATAPYAAWLQTRLDYLDAANQFRLLLPTPRIDLSKPRPMPQIPSVALEKKVWGKLVENREVPKEAAPYVTTLKPLFAAEGLPESLFWLAEVESGFNPSAKSPAGAAGLYQLMPATAKSLGLSVHWPDERLKPEKIATATARHLKALHAHFKDWKLALAAYNAGQGRIDDLMKKRKVKTFDELQPFLPAETQMYVPKFEAILQKREGRSLAQLPAPKPTS
jgi:membrane-bound lytic murein transglycosylase D